MVPPALLAVLLAHTPCAAIESGRIERSVEAIGRTRGFDQLGAIADLQHYWRTRCLEARNEAPPNIIRSLGRLLKVPAARLAVAGLLLDVGPQLSAIRSEVHAATLDQHRIEELNRKAIYPYPLLPATYNDIYNAMRCLSTKIRTSRVDGTLCETAIGTNEASDEFWNQPGGSTRDTDQPVEKRE